MGAFWSGTDLSSIDEYGEGESDLSFALVVNLKQEYKCRVSVWKPVEVHQDVELEVIRDIDEIDVPIEIMTEVKAKCRTRKFNTVMNRNTKQLSLTSHSWYNGRGLANDYKLLEDDCMVINLTDAEVATFEAKWEYALNKTAEYIRNVNLGNWSMHKYKSAITHTNKQLEPYGLQIDKLDKKGLEEFVEMNSEPYELIICTNPKYADTAETLVDYACYNGSYGGYVI
mgnify:FL=1